MDKVSDFQPLSDFVLVREVPKGTTAGGIAVPESADMGPPKAVVIAAGPGRITEEGATIPMSVKPKDIVLVALMPHSFQASIDFEGTRYGLIRQRDIVGVMTGN